MERQKGWGRNRQEPEVTAVITSTTVIVIISFLYASFSSKDSEGGRKPGSSLFWKAVVERGERRRAEGGKMCAVCFASHGEDRTWAQF